MLKFIKIKIKLFINLSSQIYVTLTFPLIHSYLYCTPLSSEEVVLGECSFYSFRIKITPPHTNAKQTDTLFSPFHTFLIKTKVTKDMHEKQR